MPSIDSFLAKMAERHADRAILIADHNAIIVVNGQPVDGPFIGREKLEQVIAEIVPSAVAAGLVATARYDSPVGPFELLIDRSNADVRLALTPKAGTGTSFQPPADSTGGKTNPRSNNEAKKSESRLEGKDVLLIVIFLAGFFLCLYWGIAFMHDHQIRTYHVAAVVLIYQFLRWLNRNA